MPDQLNHAVAVQALHDICTESEALVNSGDIRVAGEARRDYLLSSICLQLLSGVNANEFTNTELAKLPTPDELRAAASDNPNTASAIVVGAPSADNNANATPQPQTADQLANQEGGGRPVTRVVEKEDAANQANNNTSEQTTATVDANAEATRSDLNEALGSDAASNGDANA